MNNELTAALLTIEKCRELSGCPAGVDLQDWVKQLAAENVGLKNVFSQKEIPSEAVDAYMETAVMDHDWNETSEWSWVENETEVIHAVLDALKPDTPATDRIVAEIKADGVEMFALMFAEEAIKDNNITTGWKARASRAASEYAELLREGANK